MLKTKLMIPAVAAAAIGGFAWFDNQEPTENNQDSDPLATVAALSDENVESAAQVATAPVIPMAFHPVAGFDEVFRFDVYPGWVKNRWSRVSTAPGQPGLSGMRVVLVTGVNPTDLKGSLTYYFDDTHRVQKVEFSGLTDNASTFVDFMVQEFGFKNYKSLDAGLYIAGTPRKPKGVLRLTHPTTIQANRSGQIAIELEFLAPTSKFSLSARAMSIVQSAKPPKRFGF